MIRTIRTHALGWTLIALCAATLVVHPQLAEANQDILLGWQLRYPTSQSYGNAGCALCHESASAAQWNAYGNALNLLLFPTRTAAQIDAALAAVENNDSDGDPAGATNVQEIQANTQPGWRAGSNNNIYDALGTVVKTNAAAPSGISGNVDPPPLTANFEGLWWNSPAGSESGWGINFAHQGDVIFATWFTYDATGKGWWLVMTAPKTAPNTYAGTLYQTTGPAFNAVPFNPTQVTPTQVGTGTLTFSDANNAMFAYTVNGVSQTKNITRQVFGPPPTCAASAGNLATATNYQDLWWAAPASSESGWGINFTHQGDTIFATWFTYDLDGKPMWLVVTAPKTAPGTYVGTLYRTTGPAFNAVPFNPASVVPTAVGTAMLSFTDGNTGTFAYTVNGVSQTKAVTREIFNGAGTICQ
jgi:hypothetical protein